MMRLWKKRTEDAYRNEGDDPRCPSFLEELSKAQSSAEERLIRVTDKHHKVQRASGELKHRVLEQNHIREAIRYVIQEKA